MRPWPLSELRSSPSKRCLETLEPLARSRSLDVVSDGALSATRGSDRLISTIAGGAEDGVVLCTHGEAMEPLVARLDELGVDCPEGALSRETLLLKGGAWMLEGEPSRWTLRVIAPEPRRTCPTHP